MPRGVYDRTKMKRRKKAAPAPKPANGRRRGRRPKAEVLAQLAQPRRRPGRPPGRPRKTEISATPLEAREQFAIIRENLVALSQVRSHVPPNGSTDTVDTELTKQLQLMGALRQHHFGGLQEEPARYSETPEPAGAAPTPPAPPTAVPLPPPPQIPIPQARV